MSTETKKAPPVQEIREGTVRIAIWGSRSNGTGNGFKPFSSLNGRDDDTDSEGLGVRPSAGGTRNRPRLGGFGRCSSRLVRFRWVATPRGDVAASAGRHRSHCRTGSSPTCCGPVPQGHRRSAGVPGSHGPGPRERNQNPANQCLAADSLPAFYRRRGMPAIRRRRPVPLLPPQVSLSDRLGARNAVTDNLGYSRQTTVIIKQDFFTQQYTEFTLVHEILLHAYAAQTDDAGFGSSYFTAQGLWRPAGSTATNYITDWMSTDCSCTPSNPNAPPPCQGGAPKW